MVYYQIASASLLYLITISVVQAATPLDEFLTGLKTFKADFIQTVIASNHVAMRSSAGTFYLNRPGHFRWDYSDPKGQEVIADGSRVWIYDPDLEQVSHQSQKEALRGTPALLLSSSDPIDKYFEVIDLGMRENLHWIELIPRDHDSEVTKVELAFAQNLLDRFEMVDAFGQITRFLFQHVQRNPQLEPSLFRFDPPPAVDILER